MSQSAVSAEEAVSRIKSGMKVFLHGGCATPSPLIDALAARTDLEGVSLYHLHTVGRAAFAEPHQKGRFLSVSFFVGAPLRKVVEEGRAEMIPVFLSDIPALFRSGQIRLDAALLQLSPPDRHGLCSLGVSVDAARAAADSARILIAEVNTQMPRTHGDGALPATRLSAFVLTDRPLLEHEAATVGPVEARIGEIIADLVEHGSVLQVGIGAIPDAVLSRLGNKHDLGIHTEMFSDGVVPLIEGGVITNKRKATFPGRSVTSFVVGSRRLFDFVDDNSLVEFHPCDRTNDTAMIRRNERVVAINSALQIDLSGQVCADSLGHRIYSGIGGQMDFIHGAALSRIASELTPGAGVVTTRGHVHWIVTEYGAVNLHGKTLRERGEALISIAHPDFRAELRAALVRVRHYAMS